MTLRTKLPFWAAAMVPRVCSNDDRKALFLCEIHFSLIFTSRPLNYQLTNKLLITLLYNEITVHVMVPEKKEL